MIIADEPVSALDVSIQAQIINLLEDLQDEFELTYVFVAHDLGVVRHVSDRIAVMYLGKIVEIGPAEDVYYEPDPPLHGLAALGGADPRPAPERGPRAGRARGRRAEPGEPAARPAASTPAARGRPRSAPRSSRSWSTTATATGPPATTRSAAAPRARRRSRPALRRRALDAARRGRAADARPEQQHEADQDHRDAERVVHEHGEHDPDHDQQ